MNKFIVYSAGYNCEEYVRDCMLTVDLQGYPNVEHIIVDDASTDNTYEVIKENANEKTTIHRSNTNRGWLANSKKYLVCDPNDIILILDLDDFLISKNVISIINNIYTKTNCWLTYGSFIWWYSNQIEGIKYPEHVCKNKTFREYEWRAVHPQTFKGFLWNSINEKDFKDDNGKYLTSTYDQAIMYPMLEMCNKDKIKFIKDTLYIYNDVNPLNVGKIRKQEQIDNDKLIRKKEKYYENSFNDSTA